ncbi:MFS transporter [Streptosporangiaceae bacterium NEAU-GS5]|nr:MFS transporter [Streptosporangiaceae bacterium NEAU-GS5]
MNPKLYPLAFGTFAAGTGMFVMAGLVLPISHDFGVSPSAAGQFMTIFALAYAILSPVLAAVTAKVSRKRLLLIALAVYAAGNLLTAIAPAYGMALGTRVLAAAGAAILTPTASSVASALTPPEHRGRALALVLGGLTVSSAIGVPLGTWIGASNWRSTMWLVVAFSVVAFVAIAAVVPETRLPSSGRLLDRFTPLGDRRVLAVLLSQLIIFAAVFTSYTYLGTLFDLPLTAVLWAFGVGGVIGNQVGGRLTDRYGPRVMVFAGMAGATIAMALIPVAGVALVVALVWAFLWGAIGWLIGPAQQYRLVGAVPDNVPVGLGLLSSAQYLGIFVAGGAGGLVLDWYGKAGVISLATALGLVALLFTATTYRSQAAAAPEPARA